MVYSTGVASPVATEFFRTIGAREWHFGIISGISMWMLTLQFAGGIISNRIQRRKPFFLVSLISARLFYIFIAFLPLIFPAMRRSLLLGIIITFICLIHAVHNIAHPLWLSWMGDLIPRRVLNSYWGERQRWMYIAWTVSFAVVILFTWLTDLPVKTAYPILACFGVAAGVIDILLFVWVKEPVNTGAPRRKILETLTAPLKNRDFRSFLVFSCSWHGFAMFAASFMQLYVLKELNVPVWQTTLIWCVSGIGIALSSRKWGRVADTYGHRPVLVMCMSMKPLILIVFLFVSRNSAVWLLSVAFLFDSICNAGIMVASNGYTLKTAPRENRSMFIAAYTGLAGIAGGIGAIAGGVFLEAFERISFTFFHMTWTNYHLLFLSDIPLRAVCIILAFLIKEPKSRTPGQLFYEIRGTLRLTGLQLAAGFYRTVNKNITKIKNKIKNGSDNPDNNIP